MRQGIFVKLNEAKWKGFEESLANYKQLSADEISQVYVHLTEDLAYARAKYPGAQVVQYLNELTIKVHNIIYRNKPENSSRFVTFWRDEVPVLLLSLIHISEPTRPY